MNKHVQIYTKMIYKLTSYKYDLITSILQVRTKILQCNIKMKNNLSSTIENLHMAKLQKTSVKLLSY